ncbi:glycosyltransferase [Amylibacter sp.]|nr:glycosyltransferase [Amylibacter sp.]
MRWSVIGPLEGKLTGQSRVTSEVVSMLASKQKLSYKINTNFEGLKFFWRISRTFFALIYFLITLRSSFGYYISIKRGTLSAFIDFIYIIIAKIFNKKIILHLHGNEILVDSTNNKTLLINFTFLNLKLADLVICLNSFQANEIRKLGIVKLRVIPNFTDLNVEKEFTGILATEQDTIKVIYLSNFQKEKGFFKYIGLFETFPHIQFSLCGAFLSDDSLERQGFNEEHIKSLPNVQYYGFVSGNEKQHVLRNSHFIFFVSTYATEAQPLSLVEAMGLGCVPIVANRPYISDIVTKDNGVILSADPNIYEIKRAIESLTVENYFLLSGKCRTLAASFTTTAFEAKLLGVFDEFI